MANSHFRSNRLIDPAKSALLVVDIQEKLLPAIADHQRVVFNADRLVRGARLLDVPCLASVQYRKGLGPLDSRLQTHFSDPEDKLDFSAAACTGIMDTVRQRELTQIVLVGIESHICILQTALDLIAEQYDVFVVADAVASRDAASCQLALDRMQSEGVSLVSTESVLFEWCQTAANVCFKQISAIVRESI